MTNITAAFTGSMTTYIKEHVLLAALGAVLATGLLMLMGNPHAWTGAVGAVLAIAVRGVYVASEQVGMTWTLTKTHLISPADKPLPLADIDKVRVIFSAAQVVTKSGEKYMLKYQADPAATKARIEEALP